MKILGIDSSGLVASVAIVTEESMIAEYTLNHKKTHSTTLMPMLGEIVKTSEIDLEEIDAIAIAAGPGSFTGLRIGSGAAKGLAYALGKPIIPVPTTAGLAYNLYGFSGVIAPIMDARRNQVYNGLYSFEEGQFVELEKERALGIEELILELKERYSNREVIFLGDGVEPYHKMIEEKMEGRYLYAPPHLSKQRAGSVAVLGKMYYNKGVMESAFSHAPIYLRLSQAEREKKEKEDGK